VGYCRLILQSFFLTATVFVGLVSAQAIPAAKEPVPDWLAWQVFQKSIDLDNQAALKKTVPKNPASSQGPLKASPRLNGFEQAMKRQFGLSPAHTAALLASGKAYLVELQGIFDNAKGEVSRRYRTPAAIALQARGPRKTTMQRAKEDGLHATVERQREQALAAHLQALTGSLTSEQLTKVTQWVRTSIAPGITLSSPQPTFTNRGLPPGIVKPLPNTKKR
jgi:hypothetical protein